MKTEIENIIINWADEIPHILIRVINAITLSLSLIHISEPTRP